MKNYILSLDQGTSISKAIIFNKNGEIVSLVQKEYEQYYPKLGWIEQDAEEIWYSQASVAEEVLAKVGLSGNDIAGIGITNQRETTIIWDRETGIPIYNAIVWQDKRTSHICDQLKQDGYASIIRDKTGLILDAFFSATKIKWLLDNVKGAREKAEQGKLAFGTVDSWLIWKLTKGEKHVTDVSNASRTMLYNIHELKWDKEILELLQIPESILPKVCSSSEVYGMTRKSLFGVEIPISGICGDQQAALFGQSCLDKGMVNNTYNTGCFILMNTGDQPVKSKNDLITTIAWSIGEKITYALEGSVFIGGAAVQWLRDSLNLIHSIEEIEELALTEKDNGGIYIVPSFTGLGAPYWDQYARGTFWGLNMSTTAGHIARASLESIAHRSSDVLDAMEADSGLKIKQLRVGGIMANNTLLQYQADILGIPVVRPKIKEITALGAAYLAGLAVGFWSDVDEIRNQWKITKEFNVKMEKNLILHDKKYWKKALSRSLNWLDAND
ncbi:glycerol kinase GlpK [Ancylomarina longa]|uniref:Glycerol kinase n=1 Tax=Ancylomarina longa TaxID=2487017 RepID=A0A434AXQ1_9BACT|nr:glycerol kinase GlpK [Ancylomarina longa]RUT79198.1 glycerol kinase [Ancylomarina longa]